MHIPPVQSTIIFGIYKGSSQKPYGKYTWGEYKGLKIEVFDANIIKNYSMYLNALILLHQSLYIGLKAKRK